MVFFGRLTKITITLPPSMLKPFPMKIRLIKELILLTVDRKLERPIVPVK